MNSKQMRRIATNPGDYMRFMTTGRVPRMVTPTGPLIDLLMRLNPRDRLAIRGVKVGRSLGYDGSRSFDTAEQALKWIRPSDEMLEHENWPAESWRLKNFRPKLSLSELLACASSYPESLEQRYPFL